MASNNQGRFLKVNPEDITFGIEIECYLPVFYMETNNIKIGYYHHGIQLPIPFPMGWTAQDDSSLYGTSRLNDIAVRSVEIVSPVLRGTAGMRQVIDVLTILQQAGARVNDRCGFHVHVGIASILGCSVSSSPVAGRFLHRLLNLVSVHEAGIFATINSVQRLTNYYCKSISSRARDQISTTDTFDTIQGKIGDRYYTLNLQNLIKTSATVEFRIFSGSLNTLQVIGNITTALGLCHRAAQVPQAPPFNASSEPKNYRLAGDELLRALGQTTKNPIHYGWTEEIWQEYGAQVVEHHTRNIAAFAVKLARATAA